ncbi:hypothetical protein N9937_02345 [bacterium]|nr:hypothetical protein [bacterium]
MPTLQTADFGGTTATQYAGFTFELPPEYVAGETVTIRASAGMLVVSDTNCDLDFEAYLSAGDATVGSDLCTTATVTMNSGTFSNKDFTITPATLSAGSQIHIRVKITGTDSGDAAPLITGVIAKLAILCDIKG